MIERIRTFIYWRGVHAERRRLSRICIHCNRTRGGHQRSNYVTRGLHAHLEKPETIYMCIRRAHWGGVPNVTWQPQRTTGQRFTPRWPA